MHRVPGQSDQFAIPQSSVQPQSKANIEPGLMLLEIIEYLLDLDFAQHLMLNASGGNFDLHLLQSNIMRLHTPQQSND